MSRKQHEEPIPGEWQRDEWGKRFRRVGNCIEYATIIETTDGPFYEDELREYQKRKKQQEEQRLKELQSRSVQEQIRICPFKASRNEIDTKCKPDCAFYDDSACVFTRTDRKPSKDTKGRYCPIGRNCHTDCAMYNNGCVLTCIGKE